MTMRMRGTRRLVRRWLRPRFRVRFSVALVALVAGLTAATGGAIGALAWWDQRVRSGVLVDTALEQVARLAAAHATRFLRDAESSVRLGPQMVQRGLLDPQDDRALERYALGVLRASPYLSWVSYGDRDDRFVGAWRDAEGAVYLNRSFPDGSRIRLEEDLILAGGGREAVRRLDDHGYRPSERPYFQLASARRAVAWTRPYEFYAGGGTGITCVAPILDAEGRVRGVFTVDLSLDVLARFLDDLRVSEHGRALIATREGRLLAAPRPAGHGAAADDAELARAVARGLAQGDGAPHHHFRVGRERYVAQAAPLRVGDDPWLLAVIVPERDWTGAADAQARRTAAIGLGALGLAIVAGVAMARWIARPLRDLGEQARRIRRGDLDLAVPVPRSRDEIGTLARAMADMVQGLRDRDFIRDALGRYVSPELAAECLRNREALRLGGELRDVTILMSDLREFSALSERLGPETMIGLLNRYLGHMTRVILAHGGTITEFVGDAILVLFGAPFQRADDTERAVRCAWAMQQAMDRFNQESQALGLPGLAMRIGISAGPVVAGNIGSAERIKYGVVGPAVNLAARVQALAEGPGVLLTAAVLERAGGAALVGSARQVEVKGAAAPVTVHELLGVAGDPVSR